MRVLIGSTQKMGTGTNVQKRLIALHHLDAPWKPAEVEQRRAYTSTVVPTALTPWRRDAIAGCGRRGGGGPR